MEEEAKRGQTKRYSLSWEGELWCRQAFFSHSWTLVTVANSWTWNTVWYKGKELGFPAFPSPLKNR